MKRRKKKHVFFSSLLHRSMPLIVRCQVFEAYVNPSMADSLIKKEKQKGKRKDQY